REAETVLFSGWVVDRKSRREPLEILVFFRGVLVATGEVQTVRAHVNRRFDAPRTLRNGFEIAVERTAVPDLEQHGVQVVAVAAGGEPALLGPAYRLRRAPFGNDSIEVGDGRRLPVRGRTEAGALQAWRGGDALELRGRIGAGKLLLVFEGERCAYIGKARARPPEGAEPPHDAPSGLRELCVRIRSAAEPGTELSAFEVNRAGTAAELPVQTSTGAGALCEPQPEAGAAATSKESDGSDEKKGRGVAASPR
ncbi:MAG TPA: hypothetical protein VI942_10020, partial [Thermoanaerobaculia bacterium]|nr:hypothetical protein [Thermoanaerobaculia bacterium]